ncbi:hypothetical protein P9E03_12375 [Bacillus mojavensis]|jgi:hypothetical protein|nr:MULTISPECIES: hypothetical protein [Bacillus mojavensis subgroup]MBV7318243.1 hypothetical protein [Halalkalibacterium halodurans]MCY9091615.1 hypothetical protein [Bacillus mojavensis]MCY9190206.1 hypothetical protein [Bacillus mojavensis]MEC1646658.1 hypothetical protein [Bacillus halotolerans]MEC1669003.1 hypothetical protein [Bacillus mojavensis]
MTKDEEALGSGFIFSGIISKFCECMLCEHNNESKNSKRKRTNGLKPTVLFQCHI